MEFLTGIFFVLHGFVHLLYLGHSRGLFELQPNFKWPHRSWLFSRHLGEQTTRNLASIFSLVAGLGFFFAGVRFFLLDSWHQPEIWVSAILSLVLYILFWDGSTQKLDHQGGVGVLINVTILVVAYQNI